MTWTELAQLSTGQPAQPAQQPVNVKSLAQYFGNQALSQSSPTSSGMAFQPLQPVRSANNASNIMSLDTPNLFPKKQEGSSSVAQILQLAAMWFGFGI